MTAQPEQWITAEDYFVLDQQSDSKLAYYDGIIVAQAGSTARHNLIVTNLMVIYTHKPSKIAALSSPAICAYRPLINVSIPTLI